jgi:hypothetical protein
LSRWLRNRDIHRMIHQCFFCEYQIKGKCQCWSLRKGDEGHTSRWSIGRFWSRRLLDSSLKLHKVKFVRIRVILWSRKRKSYLNRDFFWWFFSS